MNIIVCIKQVPDVEGRVVVEKGAISVKALVPGDVLSSLDAYAVDAALSLRDKAGGMATLVSIGKDSAAECLRHGLAMGADEALLVSDASLSAADSATRALVLSKVIAGMGEDGDRLVICGQRSDDMQAGIMGACLAQLLGTAAVRNVVGAELPKPAPGTAQVLRLTRKLEKGNREIVECGLPAVLSIEAGERKPRHTTVRGVLRARQAVIRTVTLQELGITPEDIGQATRVKVLSVSPPKPKMKGLFVPDAKMTAADKMKAIMGGGLVQKKSNVLEGDPEKIADQVVQFFKKEKLIQP